MQDLAVPAIVRWSGDDVRVESDASLSDDCIAAVQLALAPYRRRQIGAPVETLDGRWVVYLGGVVAPPSDRAAESVCECAVCPGVWVSVHRRDISWVDIIGTPCPCAEGHTMTPTPLGLRLLAQRGLKGGADGKVAPL